MPNYRSTPSFSISKFNSPVGEKRFKDEMGDKRERRVNDKLLRDTDQVSPKSQARKSQGKAVSPARQGEVLQVEGAANARVEDALIEMWKDFDDPPSVLWDEDDFQKWLKTSEADVFIDKVLDDSFFTKPDDVGRTQYDDFNHESGRRDLYMKNKRPIDFILRKLFWKSISGSEKWSDNSGKRARSRV